MKMQNNRVYISAYSMISALGINESETKISLQKGEQKIKCDSSSAFHLPYFAQDNIPQDKDLIKASSYCLHLLDNIKKHIGNLQDIPTFLATSTGGIKETEDVYKDIQKNALKYPLFERHFFNKVINDIKKNYPNIGKCLTFSTACSSSGHGLLHAYRLIKSGAIDKALVIGYDVMSYTTLIGFDSLKLVSHTGTKPLTLDRDGLSLGDGAGVVLLESSPASQPLAELVGIASNSDGYHISSPDPAGTSQRACILSSLDQAGLVPEDIGYICAHGTGTKMNDEVELATVKSIFKHDIVMSSLKSFIGHTLGASAVTELAIAITMLRDRTIYQPNNFENPMDEIIPTKTLTKETKYFLNNAFGFGGNNVCMICKIL